MMQTLLPRIMVAAAQSGAGKTTVTCGLLRALSRQAGKIGAFKCGPDYIDPLFHSAVLGIPSGNLDLFFTSEETARALLLQGGAEQEAVILEGVMGFYDGIGGDTDRASSYHLAHATDTPVVMVLDARGTSLTLCALLNGLIRFREESGIAGVLFNRCTESQYRFLEGLIRRECGVKAYGYLPQSPDFALESRHLGLVTADEVNGLQNKLDAVADCMEKTVDLKGLLSLAQQAAPLSCKPLCIRPVTGSRPRIAVAWDRAFCFYYRENLTLLEEMGAELCFFSPLRDAGLPPDADALYLGGGYPELYARQLSQNGVMLARVRQAVQGGLPTFAECGGFLYLHETMQDMQGETLPMVGVVPAECHNTGRLSRFGYATLKAKQDTLLCPAGEEIRVHEFHYFDSSCNGGAFHAKKPSGKEWDCVVAKDTLFAGFPHFYFHTNPEIAARFVRAAARYREARL